MSLRERLRSAGTATQQSETYRRFGLLRNPFPSSNHTSGNPHHPMSDADQLVEDRIVSFLQDARSQAIVIEGTQGVGKTNFLNHVESEVKSISDDNRAYYVVRYFSDPEASFDSTLRRIFEELGVEHFTKLSQALRQDDSLIEEARSHDVRTALRRIVRSEEDISESMMSWLLGLRLLKLHRDALGVQFRLDTVESKTAALRDVVDVSIRAGILGGIILLLDELEKQDGVLSARAVVKYLSAIRAIIDALPSGLFLMLAVTPDALRRYSAALPALRGRLQNRIQILPLSDMDEALSLAKFYVDWAHEEAVRLGYGGGYESDILQRSLIEDCYRRLSDQSERRGDKGVRQREFLHKLYTLADDAMSLGD